MRCWVRHSPIPGLKLEVRASEESGRVSKDNRTSSWSHSCTSGLVFKVGVCLVDITSLDDICLDCREKCERLGTENGMTVP